MMNGAIIGLAMLQAAQSPASNSVDPLAAISGRWQVVNTDTGAFARANP